MKVEFHETRGKASRIAVDNFMENLEIVESKGLIILQLQTPIAVFTSVSLFVQIGFFLCHLVRTKLQ